ncbi:MAG: MotA/TolQ/ExbB proton channel family protein [Deltaproteobacteria bacterium]|nr:MAG: MotA/TolQ/ExbB proton channel family protein [Deltaproteobacteria bacterium]
MQDAWEFLSRGGPVMIVIGLCSVAALTLFLERLWSLQRRRVIPPRFAELLFAHLRNGRLREAAALCDSSDSPLSTIAAAALRHAGDSRDVLRAAVEERGRREAVSLERFVGGLGSIASIAPLLGLLGTITGMINTFQRVDQTLVQTGQVSPGALASGIWEALITTAAGLAVAIPTYAAYKLLLGRIDRFIIELEDHGSQIVDILVPPKGIPAHQDREGDATEASDDTRPRTSGDAS